MLSLSSPGKMRRVGIVCNRHCDAEINNGLLNEGGISAIILDFQNIRAALKIKSDNFSGDIFDFQQPFGVCDDQPKEL
jgi:hypothetical protein